MRTLLLLTTLLAACGATPITGTWQLEMNVTVQSPAGPSTPRRVTSKLFVTSGKTLPVAWSLGTCAFDLELAGNVAALPGERECTLGADDRIPIMSDLHTGGRGFSSGDKLRAKVVRFEWVRNAYQVPSEFHTFEAGEDGLDAQLELERFSPDVPDSSTTISLRTNMKNLLFRAEP